MSNLPKNIQYEPKRQNRYMVEFPKEFQLEPWFVKTANKPKYNNLGWINMKMTFIDPVEPSSSKALLNLIKFAETQRKITPLELPIFFYDLVSLDPTGVVIERWRIGVNEIIFVDFGECDYSSSDIQQPLLIIKPLFCQLNPAE
jgi:hypothetical protein